MRRRGYSLVAVLLILALTGLAIGTGARILSAHVRRTRHHLEAQYAEELARSGAAWGEAHLRSGGGEVRRAFHLVGGEVHVVVLQTEGAYRLSSTGRVLAGGRPLFERTLSEEVPILPAPGR